MLSVFISSDNIDQAVFIHCSEVMITPENNGSLQYLILKGVDEIIDQPDLYSIDYVEVTKGIDVGLILEEGVTLSLTSFTPIKKASNMVAEF